MLVTAPAPRAGAGKPALLHRLALLLSLAACLVLNLTGTALAGQIDPDYERYLSTLDDQAMVSVIIYLADQAPLAAIDAQLRADQATLVARHELVVTTLQDVAAQTQPGLLADLAARQATGKVVGFTPYWIANLVVAQMTVEAVREVAARPEVGTIYANFTVSLIEPVGGTPVAPPLGEEPQQLVNAATPGLQAINAHRVWYELGITGAGRLICGLDTGVMGSHVALGSRWRGTHVPWQHAWLDVIGTSTQFPTDTHGHGTHTMGTMTGLGVATGDTVGVAFGAEWIACNAINQGVSSEFDNDVITAFQWIADPDGDPQTVDDVPDVVQNSWRINESFPGGYQDCDPRWWAVMDGCEAAGCAVVFSAGNEGPSAGTIGSPPDRITTPTNAYAIGAVSAQAGQPFPFTIASFSSRGPSGCPGTAQEKIKPEVSAPGVEVYSTTNNGGYQSSGWSGTSMAGPHVSGIFALLREANPNLDVTTMKQLIMDTARDLGTAGEDNTYGWGIPDAYAAVSTVLQGVGEISGVVTHATLGMPIAGATVTVVGANRTYTTNASGEYRGFAPAGTYDITASHPAFVTGTQAGVELVVGTPTTVDFALTAAPDGVPPDVSGTTCFYATDDVVGPYPIEATVTDNLGFIAGVSLFYRTAQTWIEVPMPLVGPNLYRAAIPGQPLGTTVDYYVEARDAALNPGTDPPGAPNTTYSFVVANANQVFADDAELNLGWTLGLPTDTATTGRWVREDPVQTVSSTNPQLIYQPEDDHTPAPGVICFVTGNGVPGGAPGDQDVDGGCTTLVSPIFDVSGAHEAIVRYWRYYTNETTLDDIFQVDISSDGGATWQPLERVGPGSAHPWREFEKQLRCLVDLTSQMQLRFIACDQGGGSLTEALIDDVFIGRIDLGSTAVSPVDAPTGQFRLAAAKPNPFNPATFVTYEIATRDHVGLRIYDVKGRLVRTLVDGIVDPGVYTALFDGRDAGGRDLASGTYFLRLESNGNRETQKIALVR